MSRVPAELLLREDEATVDDHLEHAAARVDESDLGLGVLLFQHGRQTGGSGPVVSDDAVFDRDVHVSGLVGGGPARASAPGSLEPIIGSMAAGIKSC